MIRKSLIVCGVVSLVLLSAGSFYFLRSQVVSPDLTSFTANKFNTALPFKSCEKDGGALNIQIISDNELSFNGVPAKVTFLAAADGLSQNQPCTVPKVTSARKIETGVYSLIIAKSENGYLIGDLQNNLTGELLSGIWLYNEKS